MEKIELMIRPAQPGDETPVKSIVFKVLQEFGLQSDPNGVDADLEDLRKHFSAPGCCFLVLEDRGRIVGCGGLGKSFSGHLEVRKMYLDKAYRGLGWGKKLLQLLIQEAKNHGETLLTLETASVLTDAIRLYESMGFVRYQGEHLPARCDLAMKLDLMR